MSCSRFKTNINKFILMANLILIRHGQSQWNLENRFTGWYDAELTEQGKQEAQKSGQLIKLLEINFEKSFTSFQKRAFHTLEIILNEMGCKDLPVTRAWQLNERHYGGLQGLNKAETEKKHGKEQVLAWRRSYKTPPPKLDKNDPNHPIHNEIYKDIDPKLIPDSESLLDTYNRAVPYYIKEIESLLENEKNILVSAHGNSLRAICKKIFNISDEMITKLEIPTGNPILIKTKDLKLGTFKYLDESRAKEIITNQ